MKSSRRRWASPEWTHTLGSCGNQPRSPACHWRLSPVLSKKFFAISSILRIFPHTLGVPFLVKVSQAAPASQVILCFSAKRSDYLCGKNCAGVQIYSTACVSVYTEHLDEWWRIPSRSLSNEGVVFRNRISSLNDPVRQTNFPFAPCDIPLRGFPTRHNHLSSPAYPRSA